MSSAPKYEVYQLPLGQWAVVRLPHGFQKGDLLPHPKKKETVFKSRDEAIAHLDRLMAKKKRTSKPRGSSDPALSAFKAFRHVIDTTEGPKPKVNKTTHRAK